MFLAAAAVWFLMQPPAEAPAAPTPPEPQKAESPEPAKPKVLENTGKPMLLEPVCGTAEIHEFGLSCVEEDDCPVFLELASVETQGNKLFISGNLHTESVTLWSVLLASEDGGKTWVEPFARIRTASLDQVQFADAETGFVSGHLAQAIPKDPFFLRSNDGGKSWRRVPLFTDPEVAVIDRYRFEDRKNGMLILDRTRGVDARARYQRYETNSSGDVWGLRETSATPIPVAKPAARTAPEWRLRADARAKAYRLERRQDSRYVVVASFRIDAGACKVDPPPPPAPPPAALPSEPPAGPKPHNR